MSKNSQNINQNLEGLLRIVRLFYEAIFEAWYGVKNNTVPWAQCFAVGSLLSVGVIFGADKYIFKKIGIGFLYPTNFYLHLVYSLGLSLSGFFLWTLGRVALKRELIKRLTQCFINAGLKNALGKLPGFVFDRPLDAYTRKLRLTRAQLSLEKFKAAKPTVESALHVYIDDIREEREKGVVDIIYAHEPMALSFAFSSDQVQAGQLLIGTTRSEKLKVSFEEVPHILIAGQTGGGKSTFMRQAVTALYLQNPGYDFSMIDLKAGLEFQLFARLPRVKTVSTAGDAVFVLGTLVTELEERLSLLKFNKAPNLAYFQQLLKEKKKIPGGSSLSTSIDRHIVVIDEIAELFLSGGSVRSPDVQKAREAVSRIARLGRAVGIHLIVGTQRPDARALDTQIKANLVGKLCFPMSDLSSSLVVLGNGRAKDLPPTPGRAIWQMGLKMIEVQTPFLKSEDAEHLLTPYYEVVPEEGLPAPAKKSTGQKDRD